VLTLALGIGANTAIFSVVNAVLLRPLPFKDPSRLTLLRETSRGVGNVSVTYPDFLDWRRASRSFDQMAAAQNLGFNLSGVDQPQRINGYAVSPNFLSLLGVKPILGRDLLPSEETPGTEAVVLLSYNLWQSRLGGDPNALGRTVMLDGQAFTVVGVLPPSFRFLEPSDVIAPIGIWAGGMKRSAHSDMDVIARLAPGVSLAQAHAEMDAIVENLAREYPTTNSRSDGVFISTLQDQFVSDVRPAILVLFGAVTFVLLISSVNVANLLLVRGSARGREIAVRLTLGASRGRVISQMLTESLILAAAGASLGIGAGVWATGGLTQLVPMNMVPEGSVHLDRNVLVFTVAITLFVTALFGLAPALQISRPDLHEALKEGGRGATSGLRQQHLRGALAVAEIALALVLLVGAALMVKSLYLLLQVNPGFRPERVMTMEMNLRSSQYANDDVVRNIWPEILQRVRAIPGVESAGVGTVVPLTFNHSRADITIEGLPLPAPGDFPHPDYHIVSPGYTTALGVPLLSGRVFSESDNETAPPVALINDTLARRFWPNEDPVGRRFLFGHPAPNNPWITIVGVAGDQKLYGLANPSRLEIYLPYRQRPSRDMNIVLRSAVDPTSLTSQIRSAVAAVDKEQPIFAIAPMQQLIDDSMSTRRLTLTLLGLFSGLALVLASIGIYGVMSYSVARRTHEIGIRLAMGAQPGQVMRLVIENGLRLGGLGAVLGLLTAFASTRLMSSLLYGTGSTDAATYAIVTLVILAVALLASYLPARRAMRVDPMVALRQE
jgi:putative ABC transport system permease protein